jgi:hypothetical protein
MVTGSLSRHFANCTVRILEVCDSLVLSLYQSSLPGFVSRIAPLAVVRKDLHEECKARAVYSKTFESD